MGIGSGTHYDHDGPSSDPEYREFEIDVEEARRLASLPGFEKNGPIAFALIQARDGWIDTHAWIDDGEFTPTRCFCGYRGWTNESVPWTGRVRIRTRSGILGYGTWR